MSLQQALMIYKKVAKFALVVGGAPLLGVGAAKLVDALDSVIDNNYGVASRDVWAATSAILKLLSENLPNIRDHSSSRYFDDANEYYRAGEFENAVINYIDGLRKSAVSTYTMKELLK